MEVIGIWFFQVTDKVLEKLIEDEDFVAGK